MANEVVARGVVARLLSRFGAQVDGSQSQAAGQRIGKYGELYALTPGSPKSLLAEEGCYFSANNAQTGLAVALTNTAFSATNPFILIQNSASPGSGGPVITLDYALAGPVTVAGASTTSVQCAITKDTILRYSSGGTSLTPVKANSAGPGSVAQVYAGNITALAAGGAVATPVGFRYLKPAIPVIGDEYWIQFGAMDGLMQQYTSTSTFSLQAAPPVVLNPGESALIDIWFVAQATTACSLSAELGWWEK